MGRVNFRKKFYVHPGEVVLDYTYKELIYFIYNLGMDYYDGLGILRREDWQEILTVLKAYYTQYEVEKKIRYKEFKGGMSAFIGKKFYKHPKAYEVMMLAMECFGKGNAKAKLKALIKDFEEREIMDAEFRKIDESRA